MSKKKKEQKGLERKITSLISSPTLKEFNYKQIAFALGVNDTKGRNDIIKILNILLKKKIFYINGIDYNTSDGTCVRDYVNV